MDLFKSESAAVRELRQSAQQRARLKARAVWKQANLKPSADSPDSSGPGLSRSVTPAQTGSLPELSSGGE